MMHLQSPRYGIFTTWRFLVSNQFIASEWKRRKQKWMKGHEKSLPTTSCSTKHVVLSWCTNHALLGFLYQMGYIHAYRNDTEMKQRWYDENRWYTKWTTHIHLPLVFSDFWSFHPAKPNTALYIKNHTSSVSEVLYDVISHYNNLFFQFLRYQENVIFQFCLYSPLNEKYTLHLAQRCT